MLQYIVRSLPRLVSPQHWFAGNGGLPRFGYFADVCLAHPRDLVPDVLALDFGLVKVDFDLDFVDLDFVARFRGRFVAARDRVLLGIFSRLPLLPPLRPPIFFGSSFRNP